MEGMGLLCTIRDMDGRMYTFSAHGLTNVTGKLTDPPDRVQTGILFPDLQWAYEMMVRDKPVDYIKGKEKASWKPVRVRKAGGGGDLCLWGNRFVSCIAGSYPIIK